MTTKKSVSKSAAIREYYANNSSAKPKQIAEVLNDSGLKVTPQYVSMILSKSRRKSAKPVTRREQRSKKTVTKPAGKHSNQITMDALVAAKQLIQTTGNLAKARAALDAYAKLINNGN